MTLETKIIGGNLQNARQYEANIQPFINAKGGHSGLLVLTTPLQNFTPASVPFLNDTFGNQMNQAFTFGGTPEVITDGAGGGWTPTANQGVWDFADAGKVTITGALNNDNATWDDAGTIDMSNYVGVTGKVDLDVYNSGQNSILVQFEVGGVLVGNSVDLNDYINPGDFAEQNFTIPKNDLGVSSITVDALTILIVRSGGTKPTVKFDDIQIEETGEPIVFTAVANGHDLHVNKIRFTFVDNIAATVAAAYPTMAGLSYDKLLGVDALSNGIDIRIVLNGEIVAGASIRQLSDFVSGGSDIAMPFSDGVNTILGIDLNLSVPIILKSGQTETDFISITINDDLSGLLVFNALLGGANEV